MADRRELHLVSVNEELSNRNGSAILTVARALVGAAQKQGVVASIGGSSDKVGDLKPVVVAYRDVKRTKAALLLSSLTNFVGRPRLSFHLDPSSVQAATHIYCHNMPWLAKKLRSLNPTAHITLYAHNRLMNRVPSRTMRAVLRSFDSVAAVSGYVARDLCARAKVPTTSAVAIYNGVDSTRFAKRATRTDIDVLFVGRVVEEKGTHVLTEALLALHRRRSIRVAIVGGKEFLPGQMSPYEEQTMRAFVDHDLKIWAPGPVEPGLIPDIMNRSKVVVVPSVWQDPCPLVVLEGLASDAAVIASNVGGIADLSLDDGVVLVEPNNPSILENVIEKLLNDDEFRLSVANAGKRWASQRSWDHVYQELRSRL